MLDVALNRRSMLKVGALALGGYLALEKPLISAARESHRGPPGQVPSLPGVLLLRPCLIEPRVAWSPTNRGTGRARPGRVFPI